jgi:hypothetical protein
MKRQELKLWRPQTFSDHRLTIVARAADRPALGRDAGAVHSLQHGATILLGPVGGRPTRGVAAPVRVFKRTHK